MYAIIEFGVRESVRREQLSIAGNCIAAVSTQDDGVTMIVAAVGT
jgi:hypothetical protein